VADRLVYPLVRRLCRRRKEASGTTIYPTALQRMGLGMLCCVGGFVLAANLQQRIKRQELANAIPPNGRDGDPGKENKESKTKKRTEGRKKEKKGFERRRKKENKWCHAHASDENRGLNFLLFVFFVVCFVFLFCFVCFPPLLCPFARRPQDRPG
jgi:hypothetical protein